MAGPGRRASVDGRAATDDLEIDVVMLSNVRRLEENNFSFFVVICLLFKEEKNKNNTFFVLLYVLEDVLCDLLPFKSFYGPSY